MPQQDDRLFKLLAWLIPPLYSVTSDSIPRVTLTTVIAHVLIHFDVLDPIFTTVIRSPSIENVCASSTNVFKEGEWSRLFLSTWFHYGGWPLFFTMMFFVWQGISLERKFGSPYFAYLIVVFCVLKNGVHMVLNVWFAALLNREDLYHVCSAGFMGVAVALRILTTHYTPVRDQMIFGLFSVPNLDVPSRLTCCYVEFMVICFIVGPSSLSLLAGILVGLAYVKGSLAFFMDALWKPLASALKISRPAPRQADD